MKTSNTPDPGQNGQQCHDPRGETLKDQWIGLVRHLETREAELADRLASRKTRVNRQTDKLSNLIEQKEAEYNEDRSRIRGALNVCVQDLNAAHVTTSRHCGEIGIHYVPGQTTESDIMRVRKLSESEAAEQLNLTNGARLKADGKGALKIVAAVLCAMVSTVAWGVLILGLNLKRPLASIPGAVIAVLLGTATAMIVLRGVSRIWYAVGAKEGAGRARAEVRMALGSALALTGLILVGLIALDGLGLIRANAAKAALNPMFAIPLWLAFLAAGFINVAYISGIAYASRAEGYNDSASVTVHGLIESDEAAKKEDRKKYILVQAALDALGQVKIVEKRIEEYKGELKQVEKEFNESLAELIAAMPEEPSSLTEEERHELNVLRDKIGVAKERYDAHVSSRGVNYKIANSADLQEES